VKLIHFQYRGRPTWGAVTDAGVRLAEGNPFDGGMVVGETALSEAVSDWLPPARPTKVVCLGSNYRAHCVEMGRALPEVPKLFIKPPSAVIPHRGLIELPPNVGRVDYEGELALVIGRRARRISEAQVPEHVLGVTVLNDVTAREIQRKDVQFTRGKGYDTFCPLGPWVDTSVSFNKLRLVTRLNGEIRQDASTSDMVFGPAALVSFISHVMTLEPGDVVATGTPSGVGQLTAGDTVSVTLEGVGTLENRVVNV